jgi:hypothetical protein
MMRSTLGACGLFVLFCLSGCGDGKGSVKGTVAFDGEPVKAGSIKFQSIEGELVVEGAVVTDGAFTARVPPGKYKIEVSGTRPAGTRTQKGFDGKDEVIQLFESIVPESEPTEVIKPGDNSITLNLKSKK